MKRRTKKTGFKIIMIYVYLIANVGVYYGLTTYCDMQNVNKKEKITPASITINKSEVKFSVLDDKYVVDTSYKYDEDFQTVKYYLTPRLLKLVEKATAEITAEEFPKHS
ncbi:MAG: hypothetical protein LBM93_06090 [Oscillospiraceae bacterium]|jgi:hypothetical protein|nr:hypothetical protein [Oscillospiraceae bacterium]